MQRPPIPSRPGPASALLRRWARLALASLRAWWSALWLGTELLALTLSPSSWRGGPQRQAMLSAVYQATVPHLWGFMLLSALVSLVLIRIVVATALSYGLSQLALELLVRTLVLELIPLYAALNVALRYAMPQAQRLNLPVGAVSAEFLRQQALPQTGATLMAVPFMALLSGGVALVLTYLSVYGLTPWGLSGYTRSVGQVFSPTVSLIFVLKTFFFSWAVASVPLATRLYPPPLASTDMAQFARLFALLLVIETLSLMGNYY